MKTGGIRKLSLIDYPGEVSTVLFTTGCNFRCIYCHNSHLVLPELFPRDIPEDEIIKFLNSRKGKISAVVISGGEPTLHNDLPRFIKVIKDLGFKIKLDTNGTNPAVLMKLIAAGLIDYIAMDVKAVQEKYDTICGVKSAFTNITETIRVIKSSGLPHQFRITMVKDHHTDEDIKTIEEGLTKEKLIIQNFKYEPSVLDKNLSSANQPDLF